MTLDEAIKMYTSNAEYERTHGSLQGCMVFRQLVEWLRDYKRLLEQEPKTGHCKECKYLEYDRVVNVDGIPIIVAHEICKRWGDGCKTKEDGYCFLYEPKESEEV